MAKSIVTAAFKSLVLDQLRMDVVAGDFHGVLYEGDLEVRLITGTPTVTQDTTQDDLTYATFGGYTPTTLASWSLNRRDMAGNYLILGESIAFDCTGTPFGDVITGAVLVNTRVPDGLLVYVQMFDTPINITGAGQGINYSPEFLLEFNMTAGEGCLC